MKLNKTLYLVRPTAYDPELIGEVMTLAVPADVQRRYEAGEFWYRGQV